MPQTVDPSVDNGFRITDVIAHPVTQRLPQPTHTAWGVYEEVSIVLVEIRTEGGAVGVGECLARFSPLAYASLVEDLLRPVLVGQPASPIGRHWRNMSRTLSGRQGGALIEAISGVDIALWDLLGKQCQQPISTLLGGEGRTHVPVYGASVHWGEDAKALAGLESLLERGFRSIKVKIGGTPREAASRIALIRKAAGDEIELTADANWNFTRAEAIEVGNALHDNGYAWFEEPVRPDDEQGYRLLAEKLSVPLAAGESNFTARQALPLLQSGALAVLQPDVARAGGISETWLAAQLADTHEAQFAPHVGMSGIVCEAASLHLAAAAPNTRAMECAATANRFKSDLADMRPTVEQMRDGVVPVPTGPGLGIEINWEAVAAMRPE
ncbi:galactonate dehydratase [Aliiruegeria haliotis]|uniref:Galactonate dehydratase n=1 Tax=Aliiruegeria haliotis TaxID=1280846 RepID=A0A2T0RM30_9RHOB|nr:mandelate racemase/muconate lactonizing enzyme family protein [Aliiruegeria haliotis]PRY22191.1 galactonate dehydratase [Aliiruegeria haliotis]